jgi:hypothetical protein
MNQIKKIRINKDRVAVLVKSVVIIFGIALTIFSGLNASSYLAILGVAVIVFGALLLYVTPTKHVPLKLLNATAYAMGANLERVISELNLTEKGVYLPPKNLENIESSLIFIPEAFKTMSTTLEETNEKPLTNKKTGVFFVPPGSALSRLFEEELGFSFTKTDLNQLQNKLPKIIVEDMELAESAEIQTQGNIVTLEITGSILDEICRETDSQPKTHMQVGCLLSSAIACALAKSSGEPITIQNETRNQETKTTRIEYQILSSAEWDLLESILYSSESRALEGKATQLSFLALSEGCLNYKKIKRGINRDYGLNILEIEFDPMAIKYLEENGDVFILADIENPQFTYDKIKGYDFKADLLIKFEEFVEICKITNDSSSLSEFNAKTFNLRSSTNLKYGDLAGYVAKSGFSTIEDWLKTLKADEIPECLTGYYKLFYLYHIQYANKQMLER